MFPLNSSHNQATDDALLASDAFAIGEASTPSEAELLLDQHTTELAPSVVQWAQQLTLKKQGTNTDDARPQQAYLRAIAVAGFATWINDAQLNYGANYGRQSAEGICQIGGHRISILPVTGLPNALISIPKATLCDRSIKLFVLVESQLDDSSEQHTASTTVLTALRNSHLETDQLAESADDYLVEMAAFDLFPEQIQLYLEGLCKGLIDNESARTGLSPADMQVNRLPSTSPQLNTPQSINAHPTTSRSNVAQDKPSDWTQLSPVIPQRTNESSAGQQTARQQTARQQTARQQTTEKTRTTPIDNTAQTQPSSAEKELSELLNRFSTTDFEFPPETTGIYTDIAIAEYTLRLYALIWTVDTPADPELSLFLILGPIAGSYLPMGTRINVKENNLLLTEQNQQWTSAPTYLYTQVFGTWEEKFTVEIALPNARPVALPPLTFIEEEVETVS